MIPNELLAYPQWVLWRAVAKTDGTFTKLPYSATGGMASVIDPASWSTYEVANEAAHKLGTGIGFVLTENDPFAFIDLDNPKGDTAIIVRQMAIEDAFRTYSEISPSKTGLHIICKGAVPRGRRREKVEVYSSKRFMTVTGETYRDLPIEDRSDLLRILWDEIGGGPETENEVHESSQKHDDHVIYNMAKDAANGDKFLHLWNGEYLQAGYPSQSEADFALINILSFYSRNVEQIKRMFFMSGLGKRDKAKRKNYIDNMVQRSFDNQPPYIDLSEIEANAKKQIEQTNAAKNPFLGPLFENVPDPNYDYTIPPGLLGEIAQYIYDSSPRQIREVALIAAIGMMAGICGRSYNISGTGLNQYLLLLARTGSGKEGMISGIDRLLREVQKNVPAATDFIGPSAIASGQALIRHLSKYPCFISVVGEFGLYLQSLCAFNANSSQIMLRKTLLEIYMKSGKEDVLRSTIYSDKDKNTPVVGSPSFSILGESTAHAYYGGLDEGMIAQGLLPRFLTIEYSGKVPYLNESRQMVKPSQELIGKLSDLCANCLTLMQNVKVIDIQIEPDAVKFSRQFSRETTDAINKTDANIVQELWNRAHLKMLKLAGLLAVGTNPFDPIVNIEMMAWARGVIERDINAVLKQFEGGYVGSEANEMQQLKRVSLLLNEFIYKGYTNAMERYGVTQMMHFDKVVPWTFLQRRLLAQQAFKSDRIGATGALKRTIDTLINDGAIKEVRTHDAYTRYKVSAKLLCITDASRFTL